MQLRTTVGIGSTTFEISEFAIARPGHSFKVGDKFKPVGLVTAAHLSKPIQEFELKYYKYSMTNSHLGNLVK